MMAYECGLDEVYYRNRVFYTQKAKRKHKTHKTLEKREKLTVHKHIILGDAPTDGIINDYDDDDDVVTNIAHRIHDAIAHAHLTGSRKIIDALVVTQLISVMTLNSSASQI